MDYLFDENNFNNTEDDFFDEIETKEIDINNLLNTQISYKSKAMDIESILNALKRGDYKLPKYQRKYVWEKSDASKLILSLIKNIPIPPLYLYYDSEGKYVVLDGQQRITTIFMYYNNLFYSSSKAERERLDFKEVSDILEEIEYNNSLLKHDKTLKKEINLKTNTLYKKLKEKYNLSKTEYTLTLNENDDKNITFESFNEKSKRILRRKDLEVVFVECNDINSDKVYSEIFKLLNSAGRSLSSQEIRNGIFYNNILYDRLYDFNNQNIAWKKLYGTKSRTYKDMEYLIRFLALDYYSSYNTISEKFTITYDKSFSYSNIIDSYSKKFNRDINDVEKIELVNHDINKLTLFVNKFINTEGSTKSKGKYLLIIEAMFISLSKLNLLSTYQTDLYVLLNKIKSTPDVQQYSTQATSSKNYIEARINTVIKIIKDIIDNEY